MRALGLRQRGARGIGAGLALALRLISSARSMWPSGWPALTREPSCTAKPTNVPAALARTIAVSGATSGPENSMVAGIAVHSGRTTSRASNSSVTAALSLSRAVRLLRPTATAAAMPISNATVAPIIQGLRAVFMVWPSSLAARSLGDVAGAVAPRATNRRHGATNCTTG